MSSLLASGEVSIKSNTETKTHCELCSTNQDSILSLDSSIELKDPRPSEHALLTIGGSHGICAYFCKLWDSD